MTQPFGSPEQPQPQKAKRSYNAKPGANPFMQIDTKSNAYKNRSNNEIVLDESKTNESNQALPDRISGIANLKRVSTSVRLVAFGLDFIVCYVLGMVTTLLPFVNRLIGLETVMVFVFLSRDFFFAGRGFGKNLMGLKVIDAATCQPITLMQSALRNIVLIAPLVAFQIITTILKLAPIAWLDSAIIEIVKFICTAYIAVVLPLEGYRVLSHPKGLRKGDELAGTAIVEAPMDFSQFLPPPRA